METAGHRGKSGHMKKDGKAFKNNVGASNPTKASQDAPVQIVDSPLESWTLSTASCFHVSQHREIMENYISGNFGKVSLLNGNSMDVVGKGDVRIKLSNNATWILHDVKHIPGHQWNLISVGLLSRKGYGMKFSSDGWEVSTGDFAFTVPIDDAQPNRVTYLSTSP